MQTQFENIVAFQDDQRSVAFHLRDLEVAAIDQEIWSLVHEPQSTHAPEIREEILSWNDQPESSTSPQVNPLFQTLMINVTQVCNLRCDYCAAGGDGTYGAPVKQIELEPTYEQIDLFLDRVADGGELCVEFFGGEPLLAPRVIRQLAQYAKLSAAERGKSAVFRIVTNGTLCGPEVLELLKSIRPAVQVSIDGPPEINDIQRKSAGGKGVTQQVIKSIQTLAGIRSHLSYFHLNAVFDRNHTDVMSTWRFFRELPVDSFDFEFSLTESDSDAVERFCQQMGRVGREALRLGGRAEINRIEAFKKHFDRLDSRVKNLNFCGAGKTLFTLDANNRIFTCPWDVNDPKEAVGGPSGVRPEKEKEYKKHIVAKTDCNSCWARYMCGGGCMYSHATATGSKSVVNENFCDRMRGLLKQSILLYAQMLDGEGSR